jgi:membrane associated rhomboid family serine protease
MSCVDSISTITSMIFTIIGGLVVGVISGILVERNREKRRRPSTFVILNNAA